MNVWIKRLFILLSIGGGFTGVIIMAMLFPQVKGQIIGYMLIAGMIATFCFGIFCGFKFIEDEPRGLRLLWVFFGIQIPIFSSPIVAYKLGSGASFSISWIGWNAGIHWKVGSEMWVSIFQSQPWGLGINVFALIMFIWAGRLIKRIADNPVPAPIACDAGSPVIPDSSSMPAL